MEKWLSAVMWWSTLDAAPTEKRVAADVVGQGGKWVAFMVVEVEAATNERHACTVVGCGQAAVSSQPRMRKITHARRDAELELQDPVVARQRQRIGEPASENRRVSLQDDRLEPCGILLVASRRRGGRVPRGNARRCRPLFRRRFGGLWALP